MPHRGLALSAISALALTGLPALFTAAVADSAPIQIGEPYSLLDDGPVGPGSPARVAVTVTDAEGQPVAEGTQVVASVDNRAFLTPVDIYTTTDDEENTNTQELLTAVDQNGGAAEEGSTGGYWKSDGSSHTYTTDEQGQVVLAVAMQRNSGFDDDGLVTSTLSISAGGNTAKRPITFDAQGPLNPSPMTVTPAATSKAALPTVSTREKISYDVVAYDQFGNRTAEGYRADDADNDSAGFESEVPFCNKMGSNCSFYATSQYALDDPSLVATSYAATTQDISVTPSSTLHADNGADQDPDRAGLQVGQLQYGGSQSATALDPITWYTVDYAASAASLGATTGAPHYSGQPVSEQFKATDQKGRPIAGLKVSFFTSSDPAAQDPSNPAATAVTGADGVATATFTSPAPATFTLAARAYDLTSGRAVEVMGATTSLTFLAPPTTVPAPVGEPIKAKLHLDSEGRYDLADIEARKLAKGAAVDLFTVDRSGLRTLVADGTLKRDGEVHFKVRDRNGKKVTRYVAVVQATSRTQADETPERRIR